ncbi:hypothetical protein CC117_11770 [Parafrankia colletiae]|uniref:DUF4235 domain-containing protein n=1 Tax=Parafrankia colletiae TaxID=573497 RepID=A0A1S1R8N3_9ACTN|nr:DUF4235 domain-containing protein [Parafrankia colletiae]MCK9900859.1 DUF4235 domain-containing protein [Frankia sp. Cpl3]OHV43268.1 hypothetical protein CC117_11770 [Parafrankia colletiae]
MSGSGSKMGWKVVGGAAAALAGTAANRGVTVAYRKVRKSDPPKNPVDPDTAWSEAIVWAAVSGLAVGLGRLAAERTAARGWVRATGSLPPGMQPNSAGPKPARRPEKAPQEV